MASEKDKNLQAAKTAKAIIDRYEREKDTIFVTGGGEPQAVIGARDSLEQSLKRLESMGYDTTNFQAIGEVRLKADDPDLTDVERLKQQRDAAGGEDRVLLEQELGEARQEEAFTRFENIVLEQREIEEKARQLVSGSPQLDKDGNTMTDDKGNVIFEKKGILQQISQQIMDTTGEAQTKAIEEFKRTTEAIKQTIQENNTAALEKLGVAKEEANVLRDQAISAINSGKTEALGQLGLLKSDIEALQAPLIQAGLTGTKALQQFVEDPSKSPLFTQQGDKARELLRNQLAAQGELDTGFGQESTRQLLTGLAGQGTQQQLGAAGALAQLGQGATNVASQAASTSRTGAANIAQQAAFGITDILAKYGLASIGTTQQQAGILSGQGGQIANAQANQGAQIGQSLLGTAQQQSGLQAGIGGQVAQTQLGGAQQQSGILGQLGSAGFQNAAQNINLGQNAVNNLLSLQQLQIGKQGSGGSGVAGIVGSLLGGLI